MKTAQELIELTGQQYGLNKILEQMITTINSLANSISPNHDELLAWIQNRFNDQELTLTTMSPEQVGEYFVPLEPTNTNAIESWQLVLLHWDNLFHTVTIGAGAMIPKDIQPNV